MEIFGKRNGNSFSLRLLSLKGNIGLSYDPEIISYLCYLSLQLLIIFVAVTQDDRDKFSEVK